MYAGANTPKLKLMRLNLTMQRLCHDRAPRVLLGATFFWSAITEIHADPPVHDYPTHARVEYVSECVTTHGNKLATSYQCSCAIDRIADRLSYDDFVEASTFARYSGLPGEGGAIFRDSEQAQSLAKLYRKVEADALHACGVQS